MNLAFEEDYTDTSAVNTDPIQSRDYQVSNHLYDYDANKVKAALSQYDGVFSDIPGKINFMEYNIEMSAEVKPKACVPYKTPFHLRDQIKSEIDKWLEFGIIKKSSSPWSSPIVVVKNRDDSIRITVDYRAINKYVNVDNFPMPNIDTVIQRLYGSNYITKLDLTKAFLQIPLTPSSTKYTSFVTEFGQYEFNVVPFGIRFASGICNRIIKEVLGDCHAFVDNFVDDLIVFSSTFEDHLLHLQIVLEKLKDAGLTLNAKKCSFCHDRIKFLGFIVGQNQILPDCSKIEAIRDFPPPVTKKDMRSFLGLLNFYRRFAPNLGMFTSSLNDTLKKGAPEKICWTNEIKNSFAEAIQCLVNNVPLFIADPNSSFIVQTDACDLGLGAVLWQRVQGEDRPISFISRKLNSAEKNYATIEKECLGIKWAIEKCHDYLYGRTFIVRTDHAPLQWLNENKSRTSRRMRWALALQPYSFTVEYVKGKDNYLADVLSRYPSSR